MRGQLAGVGGPLRHAELHDGGVRRTDAARLVVTARDADELDALSVSVPEVDDDIRALCRAEQDVRADDRFRQQAAAGADLDERLAVRELEVVGLESRPGEESQPAAMRG